MRRSIRALLACVIALLAQSKQVRAAISASGNTAQPSQSTSYNFSGGGGSGSFSISETVILDPAAGPWMKSLVNSTGSGFSSGANRTIVETLTNGGAASWPGWHEHVVSRTTVNQPNDAPGFLFRQNSLSLMADYGSGFIPLTQNVDYTVVASPYPNGPAGDLGNWESIDVLFAPNRVIASGNVLKIQKDIFEIFGDSDPWRPDEAAVVAQFAVPEPASLMICGCAVAGITLVRHRRQSSGASSAP